MASLTSSFGQIIQNLHRRLDVGQHTLEEFFLVAESLGLKEEQIGIEKSPVVSKASLMHSSSTESLHTADSPAASPNLASMSTSSLLDPGNIAPPSPDPSRSPRGSVSPAPQTSASSQPLGGEGDYGQILGSDGDHGQPLGGDGDPGQPLGGDGDHGQAPVHVGEPEQTLRVSKLERICHVCFKRFPEKNFMRHMKTHEKLPKITCDKCDAKLSRGEHLRRHNRRCPR